MIEKMRAIRARTLCSTLTLVIILAPFFRPPSFFEYGPLINGSFAVWKAAGMLAIGLLFLAKPRLSLLTAVLAVYQCVVMASTLVNHSGYSVFEWANHAASIGVLCLLTDLAVDEGAAAVKTLVRALLWCLGTLCLINLVTVLLTKAGLQLYAYDYYFLGLDNCHGFFILTLLPLALLWAWSRRLSFLAQTGILALFALSIYLTWAVSSVVGASVFIVLFFVWRLRRCRRLCNIGVFYGVLAVVFLLIVVLRATEWFGFLFEDVLHKDLTLSNRTNVWTNCLSCVRAKPILGNGLHTTSAMYGVVGGDHCHNVFLQALFDGGVVGFALYLAALGLLVRPLMRTRDSFGGYILAAGMFATLMMYEAESPVCPYPFYLLFALCYHAEPVVQAMDPGPESLAAP